MSKYSSKIKSMDFKPQVFGEQVSPILIEADLQNHFNVSPSPLRESFMDLEKKGW